LGSFLGSLLGSLEPGITRPQSMKELAKRGLP
jgi:hypothetical protein